MAADFLTFCKLAVKAGVLPAGWDWPGFLRKAQGLLPYAFEKSDAKDKWGGENVFAAGGCWGTASIYVQIVGSIRRQVKAVLPPWHACLCKQLRMLRADAERICPGLHV